MCSEQGYMSHEEYMRLNAKRAGEDNALAAFKAMGGSENGKVNFCKLVKNQCPKSSYGSCEC